MEEYFLKKEELIKRHTKELEDRKYARLCFIEFIDEGAIFEVDSTGLRLYIKRDSEPKSYKEKSKYLNYLALLYDRVNEAIDKISLQFEPHSIKVEMINTSTECYLKVTVNINKPEETQRTWARPHRVDGIYSIY